MYCKWGRFTGLNFRIFRGFQGYCESVPVNLGQPLYDGVV